MLIQFGIMAVVLTARDVVSSGGFDLRVETHMFGGPMDWLRFTLLEILLISGALLIYPSFMVRWCGSHNAGCVDSETCVVISY